MNMNMSKNLFRLNPKKSISNFRVSIQQYYESREVKIWGINVLENNEKSDGVLTKFLESGDFKLQSSMEKIASTIKWREEMEIEELYSRKSGPGFWVSGVDFKGQPVCCVKLSDWCDNNTPLLSVCGCWIQLLEKAVRSLSFSENHSTVFRIVDLSDTSKSQKELIFHAFQITQQYYPLIVNDEIYIRGCSNIPRHIRKSSPCLFKSVAHLQLFKCVPIVHIPVEYGGIPPIVQDESYETIARLIDISYSSLQNVAFYCYKGSTIILRAKVIEWQDVSYGVNFFGESTQQNTYWELKRMHRYNNKKAYEEFKIKDVDEDGILLLSVYSTSFSKKKLVYLLSSFPQGSLVEVKIEKGKRKGKEGLNHLQGLQKKANVIYDQLSVSIPLE